MTSDENAFADRHRILATRRMMNAQGREVHVVVNEAESPLARLRLRNVIDGVQFEAGERLRRDFTLAGLTPRLGVDLSAPILPAARGQKVQAPLSDTVLAAKQRFSAAMRAAGPGLNDLLFDVCCHLRGLGEAERAKRWPARSAKVVLAIALDRLAEHYGLRVRGRARVRAGQLRHDALLEHAGKLRKLRVTPARIAHIFECQRQITQVPGLAVPVPQARKYPEHLDVPLQSDQIEPPQELAIVTASRTATRADQVAITADPLLNALARPTDVTILEQGHEVVANGSAQRILEIDDAGIALRRDHQVARVIVAMHEHHGLHESFGNQELERIRDDLILGIGQSHLQVPPAKPFGHQCQLACERLPVVGRQLARSIHAPRLNLREGVQRVPVQTIRIVARIETLQILGDAQILEEQKTIGGVCLEHVRHMHAEGFQ